MTTAFFDSDRTRYALTAAALVWVTLAWTTAARATCGDLTGDGNVTSSDALYVLGASTGMNPCVPTHCDADDSGATTASDALLLLSHAVGANVELACPTSWTVGHVTVESDCDEAGSRVDDTEEPIEIVPEGGSGQGAFVAGLGLGGGTSISLTLVAQISPPIIGEQTLQATSASLDPITGNLAVSYNMQGPARLGGLDLMTLSPIGQIVPMAQVLLDSTDVSAVTVRNRTIYLAQATNDLEVPEPAALEAVQVLPLLFVPTGFTRYPLTSFAGTSVAVSDTFVLTTSGDDGHLSRFDTDPEVLPPLLDPADLGLRSQLYLDDARWVEIDPDVPNRAVVVQGTPGRVTVVDTGTLAVQNSWAFTGADIPESKSMVDILGGKVFVAAGTGGVQVFNVDTGALLATVELPVVEGKDPASVVTNAVAVTDDLVFMSNGEGGLWVAESETDLSVNTGDDPLTLNIVGQIIFEDVVSVNHVATQNDLLVVASGLGGVKVVRIDTLGL